MTKVGFFDKATNEKYIHVGKYYIYKKLFYILLAVLIVMPFFFFDNLYSLFINDSNQNIKEYLYTDKALKNVSTIVKIKDKQGQIRYIGNVENGVCQGYGQLYSNTGTMVYQGDFVNNMFEGENGQLYYPSGQLQYVGSFKENQYYGLGQLYLQDGTLSKEGDFVQGQLHGQGSVYKENGTLLYTGAFINDKYDGYGTLYSKESTKISYQGEFSNNQMHGEGKLYDATGFMYYQGKMHLDAIDYSSFINASLETLETNYKHHYEIFIYQNITAFVYRKEKIMFCSQSPVTMNYSSKQQINDASGNAIFINEVELAKDIDKKDIIIDSILLLDPTLLTPTKNAQTSKAVEKVLRDSAIDVQTSAVTSEMMFRDLALQLDRKEKPAATKIGNFVYHFTKEVKTILTINSYQIDSLSYSYCSISNGNIVYVLIEDYIRKKK